MNHCLLEVKIKKAPTLRYTQDNKTPISEMEVTFEGLRADDPPGEIRVVGWGNIAQEMQNSAKEGQRVLVEGRLRMSTLPRQDGTKEKRAELTLSKLHLLSKGSPESTNANSPTPIANSADTEEVSWNSSPLVPDTDEIPF